MQQGGNILLTQPMLDTMRKNSLKFQERKFNLDVENQHVNGKCNNIWVENWLTG